MTKIADLIWGNYRIDNPNRDSIGNLVKIAIVPGSLLKVASDSEHFYGASPTEKTVGKIYLAATELARIGFYAAVVNMAVR